MIHVLAQHQLTDSKAQIHYDIKFGRNLQFIANYYNLYKLHSAFMQSVMALSHVEKVYVSHFYTSSVSKINVTISLAFYMITFKPKFRYMYTNCLKGELHVLHVVYRTTGILP